MQSARASAPVLAALATTALLAACASPRGPQEPVVQTTVTGAEIAEANIPIENLLQRKVPGLIVRRTRSGGIALQIRGSSALADAHTPPLFILNDLPFEPGPDGELLGVNPYEIETIQVLRGPEAAIYGSRAAAGVIIITTKRGGRSGQGT